MNDLVLDIESIYALPIGQRTEAIGDFLVEHSSKVAGIAARLARQFHVSPSSRDDVVQIVRTCTWNVLAEPKDPRVASNEIFTIIATRSRNEMTRFVQSSAYTGVSGMVSAQRRYSAVSQHARRMTNLLGYEPTDEEVIKSYNTQILSTRSNPGRQGALASESDLQLPTVVHDPDHILSDRVHADAGELDPAEGSWMVREVIARCTEQDPALGRVARAALGGHLEMAGDFTMSVVDICAATKMPRGEVSRLVQQLRQVAIEVLDEMGIRA